MIYLATWIVHLRIAEDILRRGYGFKPVPFAVGNIGPDSGVPNEDWSSFTPPKEITHWKGDDGKVDAQKFRDKYLDGEEAALDYDRYSFYMGYYAHLLTDMEWSVMFNEKKNDMLHKDGFDKDPNFIWTIKKDWYGLDFLYLKKHPDCLFYTLFKDIKEIPDYLDYYPPKAFERQVKYITDYYMGENEETKENFIYLTEKEMDGFVCSTVEKIDKVFREKNYEVSNI